MARSLEAILRSAPRPLPPVRMARDAWARFRRDRYGYKGVASMLSAPDANAKLAKGNRPIYGLSLLPADASGVDACNMWTAGCREACVLMTAGRGVMSNVRQAREAKTLFAAEYPAEFLSLLYAELRGIDDGIVRLNVASDVRWERVLPEAFTLDLDYYDYTKWPMDKRNTPDNYRIVYSRNERDGNDPALDYVRDGGTAAVVFSGDTLPDEWNGLPVIDGDKDDDRVSDPTGVIVGLLAKGSGKSDDSGFVVDP